jgi:radical SAM protein with 4Fe4S-binding SPASM domain
LHPGFLEIVAAIRAAGIRPSMTTGGRGITAELAREMAKAGLFAVSVSVDGLEPTHDLIRASPGSFEAALAALDHLRAAGLKTASNTQLNRLSQSDLEPLYELLKTKGISAWQVQPTAAIGRAADRPELLLQPWDLIDLVPRVVALKERGFADGILVMPGNNLGYYGPQEGALRSPTAEGLDRFPGCHAGRAVLGIESDGAIKGCPSLQSDAYVGGHIRDRSLRDIWDHAPELAFTRARTVEDLWGFCRQCPFAAGCLAGCTFTAHGLLGRPGNNPLCHFRARTFASQGLRERLVPKARAPGRPFDSGLFEIVVEPFDAPDPQPLRPERRLRVWEPVAPSLAT